MATLIGSGYAVLRHLVMYDVSWMNFALFLDYYGLWTQLVGLFCVVWFDRLYIMVVRGFLRSASLCGVLPYILVRGIVRSLLVLSTFVLEGVV